MDFYARAKELKNDIVKHRRYIHKNAEDGLELHKTKKYVIQVLQSCGIEPKPCGSGISAVIGSGRPVILLRADMDALPMKEESVEEFASSTDAAHTCGHDLHTAMLLGAAVMLKEAEADLNGTVKLMFQPAEETLEGCLNMIDHGILEDPTVDAALAYHVGAGKMPAGKYMYNAGGVMMFSADSFRICIRGKGGHGGYPHLTVDPIRIGAHLYVSLESLVSKEVPPSSKCTVTIGKFEGGKTGNIIPEDVVLEGSLRTDSKKIQQKIKERISEISESIAKAFGGSAEVSFKPGVPPLICNAELTHRIASYMNELNIPWSTPIEDVMAGASEDFALIAEKVPATYMYLSAGFDDERGDFLAHNPKVRFDEDVCPIGAASFAHCAVRWLNENHKPLDRKEY